MPVCDQAHTDCLDTPTGVQPACNRFAGSTLGARARRDIGSGYDHPERPLKRGFMPRVAELGCRTGTAPVMESGHSGVRLLSRRHVRWYP